MNGRETIYPRSALLSEAVRQAVRLAQRTQKSTGVYLLVGGTKLAVRVCDDADNYILKPAHAEVIVESWDENTLQIRYTGGESQFISKKESI